MTYHLIMVAIVRGLGASSFSPRRSQSRSKWRGNRARNCSGPSLARRAEPIPVVLPRSIPVRDNGPMWPRINTQGSAASRTARGSSSLIRGTGCGGQPCALEHRRAEGRGTDDGQGISRWVLDDVATVARSIRRGSLPRAFERGNVMLPPWPRSSPDRICRGSPPWAGVMNDREAEPKRPVTVLHFPRDDDRSSPTTGVVWRGVSLLAFKG